MPRRTTQMATEGRSEPPPEYLWGGLRALPSPRSGTARVADAAVVEAMMREVTRAEPVIWDTYVVDFGAGRSPSRATGLPQGKPRGCSSITRSDNVMGVTSQPPRTVAAPPAHE